MDFTNPAVLLGTGTVAVFALVGAFWSRLRVIFTQLFSFVIVPIDIESGILASSILGYLNKHGHRTPFGIRVFTATNLYHRDVRRFKDVAFEMIGHGEAGATFWIGWRPVWVTVTSDEARSKTGTQLRLRFIRFTFPVTFFPIAGVDVMNNASPDIESIRYDGFFVEYIHGTVDFGGKLRENGDGRVPESISDESPAPSYRLKHKPLNTTWDNLGPERRVDPFEFLVLSSQQQAIVEEVRYWHESIDWFKDHGIPWRRGYLLHGPPGTGKSSFIRAIAEKMNMPVYVFDLASFDNADFARQWKQRIHRGRSRIMVLEDIDAVFEGRRNVVLRDHKFGPSLTFDCLLNMIDGVERQDGTLLFVTTNNPDKLDEALGKVDKTGDVSRPGRVDRIVEFSSLDDNGKHAIAKRILAASNVPDHIISQMIIESSNCSPAQWQEKCFRLALDKHFEKMSR